MLLRFTLRLVVLILVIGATFFLWARYGPHPPAPPLAPDAERVDHILIEKAARKLTATLNGSVVLETDVALGFAPVGDKVREGDGKTPEGLFRVDRRNPQSAFHLSLGLDYPQPQDVEQAQELGVDPGGDIFIHGQPNGIIGLTLPGDWTAGCIAVPNDVMQRLWRLTDLGTIVEVTP